MLTLGFNTDPTRACRVLCLGAHCDDIEIGCGGTLLRLAATHPKLDVYWLVFTSTPEREREARHSAQTFLAEVAKKTVRIDALQDGYLPYLGGKVKDRFEEIKQKFSPDMIFTHYRQDLHQDHRLVAELTWNTFRNHLILEYEIPKYDGDCGSPNFFVPLNESVCRRKIDYILSAFPSQREKHWFSRELFSAILRLRGMEANAASGYAEGFYCRKAVLGMEVR
ncbi:MAG TPA: PIG-L deacetylase family protein [Methylomirabilota bacterium]|jgi:LmbE family N-acetylglucosaminyl deacetylase|nr:PIG-L deacetylase family protein [Methylomirabilota bacterium]